MIKPKKKEDQVRSFEEHFGVIEQHPLMVQISGRQAKH